LFHRERRAYRMPGQKTGSPYLDKPLDPIKVEPGATVESLLRSMSGAAFQGKNLGAAAGVWERMLDGRTLIFMGIAGALIPAGMREIFAYLIGNRYVDCVVSTGANLFHDLFETLGGHHCQGNARVSDMELNRHKIDRIYDIFVDDDKFSQGDEFVAEFASHLDLNKAYTTREFFYLLGKELTDRGTRDGILTSAYKSGVPVYCPAVADSSVGIALVLGGLKNGGRFLKFNVVRDVYETAEMAMQTERAGGRTGAIYLGGGTPKNFIQQTHVTTCYIGDTVEQKSSGHKYAVQFTQDSPHWGGLSGCTFEEAQSWGKVSQEAHMITCYCDATIALPLVANSVASSKAETVRSRALPKIELNDDGAVVAFDG
jgi:deoxyhypusine synthase